MSGVDIIVKDKSIELVYNELSTMLDQDEGVFVLTDFVELVKAKNNKALGCKNTFGKTYWFVAVDPENPHLLNGNPETPVPSGQMIPLTFRGQPILALPVATWNSKPVTTLDGLYALMKTCIV